MDSTGLYVQTTHMAGLRSFQILRRRFNVGYSKCRGTGSSVGITTGFGLDGPGIESRWGARFSALVQTGPGAHLASCTMGTGPFPVIKSGRGVTLTPHPLLVPWSRKSRAMPLLPLWTVRPVQSPSVCTRVHFTLLEMSNGGSKHKNGAVTF